MSNKVYLSGPISGLSYKEARFGWREQFAFLLNASITVLSPMRHEGHLAEIKGPLEKAYPDNLFSHPKMIVAKDFLDVDQSAIVVANFLGAQRVSIGTAVELGYAYAKGKTIVVIMDKNNIHVHPFITEIAATVVGSVTEAAHVVNSLLSEGI